MLLIKIDTLLYVPCAGIHSLRRPEQTSCQEAVPRYVGVGSGGAAFLYLVQCHGCRVLFCFVMSRDSWFT